MSWQERAACDGQLTALFFPGSGQDYRKAKAFCNGCPVTQQCLNYARKHERDGIRFGMYGGLEPDERSLLFGVS